MSPAPPDSVPRCDSLFIAPCAEDILLACPARLRAEVEKGRRAAVFALFEDPVIDGAAVRALRELGVSYVGVGLPSAIERRGGGGLLSERAMRLATDEPAAREAARFLAVAGPHTEAVHVFAPLGLGMSIDHQLTYEAGVRAFATEPGRNLFLYEERPEAFVPGAVRTRLALLGARLPPEAQAVAARPSVLRHLWAANEPRRLRGLTGGFVDGLALVAAARRRLRDARPWSPSRAFGPRLQPIVHLADEVTSAWTCTLARALLPADRKGRPRAAERFNARARLAGRKLGGVSHAERFWLFLPSGDGLPEVQHPLEMTEA